MKSLVTPIAVILLAAAMWTFVGIFYANRPQAVEIQKLERQVERVQEYADDQTRRLSHEKTRANNYEAGYEEYLQQKWDTAQGNDKPGSSKLCVTETDDKTVMIVKACK